MVDAKGVQRLVAAQRTVVVDKVGTKLAGLVLGVVALRHVEGFLVPRYQNPVGPADVEGGPLQLPLAVARQVQPQHRHVVQFLISRRRVEGVGEPDSALFVHGQIVGIIVLFAFQLVGHGRHGRLVVLEANDAAAAALTTEKVALCIKT